MQRGKRTPAKAAALEADTEQRHSASCAQLDTQQFNTKQQRSEAGAHPPRAAALEADTM